MTQEVSTVIFEKVYYDFSQVGYITSSGFTDIKEDALKTSYPIPSKVVGGVIVLTSFKMPDEDLKFVCIDETGNEIEGVMTEKKSINSYVMKYDYTFTNKLPGGSKIGWKILSSSLTKEDVILQCVGGIIYEVEQPKVQYFYKGKMYSHPVDEIKMV